MTLSRILLTSAILLSSASAKADYLLIPDLTILGTETIFTGGPSFTVNRDYSAADLISLRGTGVVDFDGGNVPVNVAGVVITTRGLPAGTVFGPVSNPTGALVIGNSLIGYFPLFPANTSTGLGSPTPPTDITVLDRSLGDIFGPNFVGLTSGTMLNVRINDGDTFNNSGSFRISSVSNAVPEPGSLALMGSGVLGLASYAWKRRRG